LHFYTYEKTAISIESDFRPKRLGDVILEPLNRNSRREASQMPHRRTIHTPSQRQRRRDEYTPRHRPMRREAGPQRRRSRRQGLSGRFWAVILLPITAVAIIIVLLSNLLGARTEPEPRAGDNPARAGYESPASPGYDYPADGNTTVNGYMGEENITYPSHGIPLTRVSILDIEDTGYLALVNRWNPIQSKPYNGLLTGAWPTVAVSRVYDMYLHMSALQAVSEMFASARQSDIAAFFVSSGFRSYDAQALLYGDGSNSAFVQPPGRSEHHTGLAADILAPGIGMMEMGNTPEGQWLAENSYRYGLILRYPYGATAITGIEYEPWHFRYVGRAHAYFMKHSNLVLEEYIAHIHNYRYISFVKGDQTYYVMHQVPEDGMIYVPYTMNFSVSADNTGGFIVVAWG